MTSLAELIGKQPGLDVGLLQATVTATAAGGTATIHFGDATQTIAGVRMLASASATVGDTVWVVRNGNTLFILGKLGGGTAATVPVGSITAYWGTTAPSGWLLCDGAAIPAQYTALIALVGANTPNLKGRVIVGYNAAEAEFDALGETGGAKTVALSGAETGAHSHGLNAHTHGGTTGNDSPDHVHSSARVRNTGAHAHNNDAVNEVGASPDSGSFFGTGYSTFGASVRHAHSIPADSGSTTATSAASAHQNMPPYMAIAYIIKAS